MKTLIKAVESAVELTESASEADIAMYSDDDLRRKTCIEEHNAAWSRWMNVKDLAKRMAQREALIAEGYRLGLDAPTQTTDEQLKSLNDMDEEG